MTPAGLTRVLVCGLVWIVLGLGTSVTSWAQSDNPERLAMRYWEQQEPEKALSIWRGLAKNKISPTVFSAYFEALIQTKDYDEAESLIKKYERWYPYDLTVMADSYRLYQLSGTKKKLERLIKDIQAKVLGQGMACVEVSNKLKNAGYLEMALSVLEWGRSEADASPVWFATEASELYERLHLYDALVETYVVLIDYDPQQISWVQQRLQAFMAQDSDQKQSKALVQQLQKKAHDNPNSVGIQHLNIWFMLQMQQFDALMKSVKSYSLRYRDQGLMWFDVAEMLRDLKVYDRAESAYREVIALGTTSPYYWPARKGMIHVLEGRYLESHERDEPALIALETAYQTILSEIPKDAEAAGLMRSWAKIKAFYRQQFEQAESLLQEALSLRTAPQVKALIKMDLADILLFEGDIWEANLLYAQVEKDFKHDEIGFEAKLKNAFLAYYSGNFDWALSQLDVLRAATSKLIANDAMALSLVIRENLDADSSYGGLRLFAAADLAIYRKDLNHAEAYLDSLQSAYLKHPLADESLMRRAHICALKGLYSDALKHYETVYTRHNDGLYGDEALWEAALLEEKNLNPIGAMALLEKLIQSYPGSFYLKSARDTFRRLRGDLIQN